MGTNLESSPFLHPHMTYLTKSRGHFTGIDWVSSMKTILKFVYISRLSTFDLAGV